MKPIYFVLLIYFFLFAKINNMKKYNLPIKLFLGITTSLLMVGCKGQMEPFSSVPHCVNTMELASLNTGMTKGEAISKLGGLYPYDVLAADETGCEIFQYRYRRPKKEVSSTRSWFRETLRDGKRVYETKDNNAFLVFKGGRLDFVLTENDPSVEKVLSEIAMYKVTCTESNLMSRLKGCTDKSALNYNEKAKTDNGTCEYCPCGYEINRGFNDKRPISDCNQKCTETDESKARRAAEALRIEAERLRKLEESRRCTNCDLIEKLMNGKGGNININLDVNAGSKAKTTVQTETISEVINAPVTNKIKAPKTKEKSVKSKKDNTDVSWFKRKAKVSDTPVKEPSNDHVSLF